MLIDHDGICVVVVRKEAAEFSIQSERRCWTRSRQRWMTKKEGHVEVLLD